MQLSVQLNENYFCTLYFFDSLGDVLDILDNTGFLFDVDFCDLAASFLRMSSSMAGVGLSIGTSFSTSSILPSTTPSAVPLLFYYTTQYETKSIYV